MLFGGRGVGKEVGYVRLSVWARIRGFFRVVSFERVWKDSKLMFFWAEEEGDDREEVGVPEDEVVEEGEEEEVVESCCRAKRPVGIPFDAW